MILKLLVIVLVSVIVFWFVGKGWPRLKTTFRQRLLPLILSPVAFPILKRVFWVLLRLLFRR